MHSSQLHYSQNQSIVVKRFKKKTGLTRHGCQNGLCAVSCRLCLAGGHLYIGGADFLQGCAYRGADFTRLGMASDFFLAKDALAIDPNIKYAAAARHQFPAADVILDLALVQDFVRQTDGLGLVPSSGAVFDDDVHDPILHDTLSFIATRFFRHFECSTVWLDLQARRAK